MNKHRATFTLDQETDTVLRRTAERLSKPMSEVVREAIQEYGAQVGQLTEGERLRLLTAFDQHVPQIPRRPQAEVDAELNEIRRARRSGGRRSERETAHGDGDDTGGASR